MSQSKYWCFTLNNYTDDEVEAIKQGEHTYLIMGREMGTMGTPHLQGYVEFETRKRLTGAKNALGCNRAHMEAAKGNHAQNKIYCTKEDHQFIEMGTPRNRNIKKADFIEMIKTLKTDKEIFENFPDKYVKNFSGIAKAKNLFIKPRNWTMDIEIYYGKTGTGKTQSAWKYQYDHGMEIFEVNLQDKTFPMEGYSQEPIILLDEFRSQLPYGFLLKLMDSKPMKVNVKYGSREITAKKLVITTNLQPWEWYPKIEDKSALYRRINEFATIWDFKKYGEVPDLRLDDIGEYNFAIGTGNKPSTTEDYRLDDLFPNNVLRPLKKRRSEVIEIPEPPTPIGPGPQEDIFDLELNSNASTDLDEDTEITEKDLPKELFTQEEIDMVDKMVDDECEFLGYKEK